MQHALRENKSYPPERRNITYAVLLVLVLASLLILTVIFVSPFLTNVPTQASSSSDWSGYSVASDLVNPQPQVTGVNASWTVPTVNVSLGDTFSAAWIGIGGQFDETLIQTGTEHDSVNGQASYSAWYELLPYDAVTIDSLSTSPGDIISASISFLNATTNTWLIEIRDVTNGQTFQESLVYDSSMLSAEWIVERPTINDRLATLANFSQITFTSCTATISGEIGAIDSFPSTQFTMYSRQNIQLVSVSSFTSTGTSFTVNYLD